MARGLIAHSTSGAMSLHNPPFFLPLTNDVLFGFSFFKDFIYLFLERGGRKGEREGEKHQCVVASCMSPTGDLAHNPGMCPDWESNWLPFGSQAST